MILSFFLDMCTPGFSYLDYWLMFTEIDFAFIEISFSDYYYYNF